MFLSLEWRWGKHLFLLPCWLEGNRLCLFCKEELCLLHLCFPAQRFASWRQLSPVAFNACQMMVPRSWQRGRKARKRRTFTKWVVTNKLRSVVNPRTNSQVPWINHKWFIHLYSMKQQSCSTIIGIWNSSIMFIVLKSEFVYFSESILIKSWPKTVCTVFSMKEANNNIYTSKWHLGYFFS